MNQPVFSQALVDIDTELRPSIDGIAMGHRNRMTLLEHIHALGSISQAAKAVPMSYKAAWDAIDAMNNMAPTPLVLRNTGGKGGGASQLTEFGLAFLGEFQRLEAAHQHMMAQLRSSAFQTHFELWRNLNMNFSADNQLMGRVSNIVVGAVNSEIHLTLANGHTLVGIITQDSVQRMDLNIGDEAFALIQASAIVLANEVGDVKLSARNQLTGRISRVHTGSVNSMVTVDIGQHMTLQAQLSCASCEHMGLAVGQDVMLLIKAPNIIFACHK